MCVCLRAWVRVCSSLILLFLLCDLFTQGHTDTIRCLQTSPDGRWIISGGDDGTTKVRSVDLSLVALECIHDF